MRGFCEGFVWLGGWWDEGELRGEVDNSPLSTLPQQSSSTHSMICELSKCLFMRNASSKEIILNEF